MDNDQQQGQDQDGHDQELEAAANLAPEDLGDSLSNDIAERWDPDRILKLVSARAGKGEALEHSLRSRYERKLGVDLSHVRVYSGELAEEVNKSHNAHALTIGGTGMILMGGTSEKSMGSAQGQALLAHELTHVAQSRRGVFMSGGDDMPMAHEESEAEAEDFEMQELSELQGGSGAGSEAEEGQPDGMKHGKMVEMVLARVMDMFAEAGRVMLTRGGPFPRRA